MAGHRIRLKNYRVDRHGRLVKSTAHLDVSARLRMRSSKRIRVVKRVGG